MCLLHGTPSIAGGGVPLYLIRKECEMKVWVTYSNAEPETFEAGVDCTVEEQKDAVKMLAYIAANVYTQCWRYTPEEEARKPFL